MANTMDGLLQLYSQGLAEAAQKAQFAQEQQRMVQDRLSRESMAMADRQQQQQQFNARQALDEKDFGLRQQQQKMQQEQFDIAQRNRVMEMISSGALKETGAMPRTVMEVGAQIPKGDMQFNNNVYELTTPGSRRADELTEVRNADKKFAMDAFNAIKDNPRINPSLKQRLWIKGMVGQDMGADPKEDIQDLYFLAMSPDVDPVLRASAKAAIQFKLEEIKLRASYTGMNNPGWAAQGREEAARQEFGRVMQIINADPNLQKVYYGGTPSDKRAIFSRFTSNPDTLGLLNTAVGPDTVKSMEQFMVEKMDSAQRQQSYSGLDALFKNVNPRNIAPPTQPNPLIPVLPRR